MKKNENNIENLFKEGLYNYEISPPEEVWDGISNQLKKKKSRKLIILWYRIAAGMTIFLTSVWFITHIVFNEKNINKTNEISEQIIKEEIATPKYSNKNNSTSEFQKTDNQNKNLGSAKQQTIEASNKSKQKEDLTKNNETINHRRNFSQIFKVKTQEEQFEPTVNFEPADPIIPSEELAMMNIVLDSKKPEEGQVIYDIIELNVATIKPVVENKWKLGGYYAPLYSYRIVELENESQTSNTVMNNSEEGQYTYSGGFSINYNITKRLSIGTGLSVVNHSYKVSNVASISSSFDNLTYASDLYLDAKSAQTYSVNNSIGEIEQTGESSVYLSVNESAVGESFAGISYNYALPAEDKEITQSFDYMEIPLFLRFKIIDRKVGLNFVSGVSSYFLVNNKVTIKSESQADITGKTVEIKTSNLSGSLGLGVSYSFNKKFTFNMEPLFKIFLNSINTSNSINAYPYTFGIYSGVLYNF